jgi:phospholipid/cholesterol/gamma-HCH transport system substrate-binding protein
MKRSQISNAKLGLFVIAGILFLVFTLYAIAKNRNLLGSTFILKARVSNVNGLVPGNNVRFKGIEVGTVEKIEILDDTSIYVTMLIDKDMKRFIKQNAIATIGTDGLMGNKLVNINSVGISDNPVENGTILSSRKPIETDEMLRTLNTTNNNIANITKNLHEVTVKLNNSNSLWNLLSDTVITHDLRSAVKDIRLAGNNSANFTARANDLIIKLDQGEGLASTIFTDTSLTEELKNSIQNIQVASRQTSDIMRNLDSLVSNLKQGNGTAGLLLSDSITKLRLQQSILNIESGTSSFNQNMEALKHNFLFRKYFRKLEKEKLKESASNK